MSATDLPVPSIPASAVFDFLPEKTSAKTEFPSILDVRNARFTTSGRSSIALALEHANVGKDDEVLIPAYHCEAMVAPTRWRGAVAVFYRINKDTSVRLEDIAAKITHKTKAIIVTHYFGFEQPHLIDVKELCESRGLVLIEDCAHALFGMTGGRAIGTTGDYAVASCMKFLPIYEGGLICSTTRDISDIKLIEPGLMFQLKSAVNCLENSVNYGRCGGLGRIINLLLKFKDRFWTYLKSLRSGGNQRLGPSSSEGGFGLDEAWIHKAMSWFSQWVVRNAPLGYIATQRRQNYQAFIDVLNNLPTCRPLFPVLEAHTVPWVFPVYVDEPEKYFMLLREKGVPVWHFGEFLDAAVTKELCPVSVEYSKHVFQFPCHQSLKPGEIDWMLNEIKQIFTK